MPFEFEADEHFFKDVAGDDVEPIAQVPDEGLSLIHISEPRDQRGSRMPSSA